MLKLIIPGDEVYNEETQEFTTINDIVVYLEHSLLSLSKWEAKFQKPFLSSNDKTQDEIFDYIRCMILDKTYPDNILNRFSEENFNQINNYINSKESATTFGTMPEPNKGRGEIITSELIYYWMVAFNIPFECETWHINRLFSLIRICNIKQSKPKKMSRNEIAQRNRELNAQRKAQLNTTG